MLFLILFLIITFTVQSSGTGKCSWKELSNSITEVNCSNLQLDRPPLSHDSYNTSSKLIIDLSHNRIRDTSWGSIQKILKISHPKQRYLNLCDNIFTEIPEALAKINVKIDIRNNPLHCDCSTLRLAKSILVNVTTTTCATSSNPDIRNKYLSGIQPADLGCGEDRLVLPAEITLYKIPNQIIPCRKYSDMGTVSWIKHGYVVFQTQNKDCSLILKRYVNPSDTGYYEILYETPYDNTTEYVNVHIETVVEEPVIHNENQIIGVEKNNGLVKIECNATGIPQPTISWLFNNRSLTNADKNIITVDEKTLILTNVDKEMVFKCIASNVFGTADAGFIVRISNPDKIGIIFSWLGPLSLSMLFLVIGVSVIYILYSKHTVAKLKERCASPGSTSSGTIFENSEATSSITQYEGYKIVAISTSSPPHQLICPITRECMKNPVVASDGFSYEEKAILAWFKRNSTSPMTNNEISKRLIQNHNLRTLTRDLMDKRPISDSFVNVDAVSPKESTATQTRTLPRTRVSPNTELNISQLKDTSNVSIDRSRVSSAISRTSGSISSPECSRSSASSTRGTSSPEHDIMEPSPSSINNTSNEVSFHRDVCRDSVIPMENSQV